MPRFLSPYELNEIYGVLQDRDYPTPTELQSNFGLVQPFTTETINMDKIAPDLRVAQFVAPDVSAKATTIRGYETKVYYPGYWKDKGTVDFRNIRARRVGEQISVPTSTAGKIAQGIQDVMQIMRDKRDRLMETVAADILLYGMYKMESALHPMILVDLEPNVANSKATLEGGKANRANLTATAVPLPDGTTLPVINDNGGNGKRAWNATGATAANSPVEDLQLMLNSAWEPITKIYMGDTAWNYLIKDPNINKYLATDLSTIGVFQAKLLPEQQNKEGLKLRGIFNGIPVYTYNAVYQKITDNSSTLSKFIPDGWVIMVPDSRYGVRAYGAVQHGLADFQAVDIFFNSWVEEEFGTPWVQAQSAPLFLHTKIQSTVAWKVIDGI